MLWVLVSERPPAHCGPVWAYGVDDGCESSGIPEVQLAAYHDGDWLDYRTDGDSSGLNTVHIHDVTHWAEVDWPEAPEVA